MTLSHIPIIAIDPSRTCGYAYWDPETKRVFHGSWNFGNSGNRGEYYCRFEDCIEEFLEKHGLSKDLRVQFVIESPAPGARRTHDSLKLSEGWSEILERYCYRRKLARPVLAFISSWRVYFLSGLIKPKAFRGPEATKWYKEQVILRCNKLGQTPKNDNAADAIGILKWFKDGQASELDKRRELRRREKANKRAQAKLRFEDA